MQPNQNSVSLSVSLQVQLRQEDDVWVAWCPAIDVASQADSPAEAESALREAIELWFDDCLERGVLQQALEEVGFHLATPQTPSCPSVGVNNPPLEKFLQVTVPGWEATAQ